MYSWKDKLADWWRNLTARLNLNRGRVIHVCWTMGISLIIVAIVLAIVWSGLNTDIRQQDAQLDTSLAAIMDQVNTKLDQLESAVHQQINSQWDVVADNLTEFNARLAQIYRGLDSLGQRESAAFLAGDAGNYTLYIKSVSGGNFTANIHLLHSPGVGNLTSYTETVTWFQTGVNWTLEDVPAYVCGAAFNGTAWSVVDVWFNAGTFAVLPCRQAEFPVTCVGLNSTWTDALAYVDVFRLNAGG